MITIMPDTITREEFISQIAAEKRRAYRQAKTFADCLIAAIRADDCDNFYRIGTSDDFYGGWRLALRRISKDAVSKISPQIKQTFQQVWLEHKHMALEFDDRQLLCQALRRLLPPYDGPAVTLYRGATLEGWRDGVSWTVDIAIAREFFREDLLTISDGPTPVIVKTLAPPEAVICKIEYPVPFSEEEKAERRKDYPGCRFVEFHDEQEYIVDSERLTGFEIVARRIRVQATLERSSVRRGASADCGQTLLFRDVKDAATNDIIRDHAWLPDGEWWSSAANDWMATHNRHMQGIAVEFTVTIAPLVKGYLGDSLSERAIDRPAPRIDEMGFLDPADLVVIG